MDQQAASIKDLRQQVSEGTAHAIELAATIAEHGEVLDKLKSKVAVPYHRLKELDHAPHDLGENFESFLKRFNLHE